MLVSGDERASTPAYEPTQEVRFAVVMYGGVSLAIYINGVAQELLQLVRATAPESATSQAPGAALHSDEELSGTTAAVYREAGRLLSFGSPPHPAGEAPSGPIRTRFVVDILSGTSAGGINGVYLAKALVNNQEIDRLKAFWVDKADIAGFVNDRESYDGLGEVRRQRPPEAALNSARMYWTLLEALDEMDEGHPDVPPPSPLVDELDLWITATDVRGITVPLDLYDRLIFERRYGKAFHFNYGRPGGDDEASRGQFGRSHNPFLAFVARSTSSFPFAFEPMRLSDIDPILRSARFRSAYGDRLSDNEDWSRFFDEYLKKGDASTLQEIAKRKDDEASYRTQSFADGGYLDNKPFSWAINTLQDRRAELPVDRRLIYIEPDPGAAWVSPHAAGERASLATAWKEVGPLAHLSDEAARTRPDAIENTSAALFGIPRYEPIRHDLERVTELNHGADRRRRLTTIIDELDPAMLPDQVQVVAPHVQPADRALDERGVLYAAYHKLKIATTIDDLAQLVAYLAGLDERSAELDVVRLRVQTWFDRAYPIDGVDEHSQFKFLLRFDMQYRLRRISYLQRRTDEELRTAEADARTVEALRGLKRLLSGTLEALRLAQRELRSRVPANAMLLERIEQTGLGRPEVTEMLQDMASGEQPEPGRRRSGEAAVALDEKRQAESQGLEQVMERIAERLEPAFDKAREEVGGAIRALPEGRSRERLRKVFDHYEAYDSIRFPVSYGGQDLEDRVEVVRISPRDATSIIDESRTDARNRKLAGAALGHFGGFFDRGWRRNDLMWGRLDAAERILATLLPEGSTRDRLLRDAQLAILREELEAEGQEELIKALVQTMLAGSVKAPSGEDKVREALEGLRTPEATLEFLKSGEFAVDRDLDARRLVKTAGRLTTVTGDVLDGIATTPAAKRPTRWLARIGRLVSGLAELATRNTFFRVLARNWAQLVLLIGALLIVVGVVTGGPEMTRAGWILVGVIVALKVITWLFEELTLSGPSRRRAIWVVGIIAALLAVASTAWAATEIHGSASDAVCDLPDGVESAIQDVLVLDEDRCR